MKKILLVILLILILNGCSVQENMNNKILLARLSDEYGISFDDKSVLSIEDNSIVLFSDDNILVELISNNKNDVFEIRLSSTDPKNIGSFIDFAEKITDIYSNDDFEFVKKNLFINEFNHYKTRWYSYSSVKGENGLYFSINNCKLNPEKNELPTLKPNERIELKKTH